MNTCGEPARLNLVVGVESRRPGFRVGLVDKRILLGQGVGDGCKDLKAKQAIHLVCMDALRNDVREQGWWWRLVGAMVGMAGGAIFSAVRGRGLLRV